MDSISNGFDAYAPREVPARVKEFCLAKARLPLLSLAMLGVLAGVFIGLGAMMYTLVLSDASLGFAAQRLLGGLAFSLGIVLVTVAGAELFTGNNLLAMGWADGCISTRQVLRNWTVVCATNFGGAVALALLVWLSAQAEMNGGAVGATAVRIAVSKANLGPVEAFIRGMLCNVLVCMAAWMSLAGRSLTDKAVAIVFPITAFVAAGFEHSIANMYLMPLAMLLGAPIGVLDMLLNLVPVIAGNLIGGSVLVALGYHLIYVRPGQRATSEDADRLPRASRHRLR
jgi:formate/nitrite transporter